MPRFSVRIIKQLPNMVRRKTTLHKWRAWNNDMTPPPSSCVSKSIITPSSDVEMASDGFERPHIVDLL
jgi:hypothetical protein